MIALRVLCGTLLWMSAGCGGGATTHPNSAPAAQPNAIATQENPAPVQPSAPALVPPPAAVPISPSHPALDAGVAAPIELRPTARITFSTIPSTHATVIWGKRTLGMIDPKQPLVVERPRDSGPLDVIIRAGGYMPVQTRAQTFGDSRVTVKLTTPAQKNTLVGYREPIDAGGPLMSDPSGASESTLSP
jgi:hypothetical protein